MLELLKRNKWFYGGYALLFLVCCYSLLSFSKQELFVYFNSNRNKLADTFYFYLTAFGDGWFFVSLILLSLLLKYRYTVVAVSTYALSSLIAQGLKRLLFAGEPRPYEYFKNTEVSVLTTPGNELLSFNSFPSGHTTTAFAIACLLACFSKHKKLAVLFLIPAVLTGLSRMYLGQHFFADIATGSLIGVLSATVCQYLINQYEKPWMEKKLVLFR